MGSSHLVIFVGWPWVGVSWLFMGEGVGGLAVDAGGWVDVGVAGPEDEGLGDVVLDAEPPFPSPDSSKFSLVSVSYQA